MSARRGNTRGYLAQLATPLSAGEAVFSVRGDLANRRSRTSPQTPAIEDVIVEGDTGRGVEDAVVSEATRATSSDAHRLKTPRVDVVKSVPADSRSGGAEGTAGKEPTATLPGSEFRRVAISEGARHAAANQFEWAEQVAGGRFAPRVMNSSSDLATRPSGRARGGDENAHYESGSRDADAQMKMAKVSHVAVPLGARHSSVAIADSVQTEAAQTVSTGRPEKRHEGSRESSVGQRREHANARIVAAAKSAPKVVIGTIEIRTRVMPAAAPPVPVQVSPESSTGKFNPNGSRSAIADPVVRSLAWNYGFIQG